MTVKAWLTISAIVLVALTVSVVVRLLQPAPAPEILARVGDTRLEGELIEACWPQRGGEIRCEDGDGGGPATKSVPSEGTLRVAVYPVEPKSGTVTVRGADGDEVLSRRWTKAVRYELDPGTYDVVAAADYGSGAKVSYRFRLTAR